MLLEGVLTGIDDVRAGSLLAALALMFFPVMLYGVYAPFAIRLILRSTQHAGVVSGTIYGVSTAGSIVGTLGTTFVLIPSIGTRAISFPSPGLISSWCFAARRHRFCTIVFPQGMEALRMIFLPLEEVILSKRSI